MASVASAAATTIVDPFSVRGSLPDNSIIRYCRAEWQVVIYGAHIHAVVAAAAAAAASEVT